MTWIDYLIIAGYLLGLLAVGVFARSKINTVDDYLVAGNRFSTFSLTGTLLASMIGSGMVLGMIGTSYTYGSGILWNFIGCSVGMVIFALVYVDKIREKESRSLAEIVAGRFGRLPRAVVGIFACVYSFSFLSIGITGMARMFTYLTDGAISIVAATVISAAVGIILTALGGLYSVVWTDTIQFCIMAAMLVIVSPIIAIKETGSIMVIDQALAGVGGSLMNPVKNVPISYISLAFFTLAVSGLADPTVPQRALAGKNNKVVKSALCLTGAIYVLFGWALALIGGASIALMPDIANTYGTTEAAFPLFILNYFPPVIAGLAISALLSAIISSITSYLLVGTTHLIYDFGQSMFSKVDDKVFEKLIPIGTIVFGALITFVSLRIESLASTLYFACSLCGAAFIIPMLATLYWKRASKWGVTLSVLGGGMTVLVMCMLGRSGFGGDPVYTGLLVSLIACVAGSYAFPQVNISKTVSSER